MGLGYVALVFKDSLILACLWGVLGVLDLLYGVRGRRISLDLGYSCWVRRRPQGGVMNFQILGVARVCRLERWLGLMILCFAKACCRLLVS